MRHPSIRKIKWLDPVVKAVFNRRYWLPCRGTVANGLSVGLFCAMLPIPFQMIVAALGCLRARGNVPTAVAACWITNPVTQIPVMALQERFGFWLHESVGIPRPPYLSNMEMSFNTPRVELFGTLLLEGGATTANIGNFVLGFLSTGLFLALLAYPIIYGICLFLPNRGKPQEPVPLADTDD